MPDRQVEAEQNYLSMLYDRLDDARDQASGAMSRAHGDHGVGTAQAMVEREAVAGEHARRLAQLGNVEHGLCFGRIDDADEGPLYIGRVGLRDEEGDPVLIDWRAPAARPFYTATPGDHGNLTRRRHLHTRLRRIVGLDDEVFDLEAMSDDDRATLVGEAALLSTLRRARTGRMSEVVATIQTEQDRVIRSGLHGALVVQGGPGTGKTVAALHRAAYLLYTHRDVLERRGVLIVGPNELFSRYIEQVLPSLGENDVVMTTLGGLLPGVRAELEDGHEAAAIKGRAEMADVLARAVRDRERAPEGDLEVAIPARTSIRGGVEVVVDWTTLKVPHETIRLARDRASATRRPHNDVRPLFALDVLRGLAAAQVDWFEELTDEEELGVVLPDDGDSWLELPPDEEEVRLRDEADLRHSVRELWAEPAVGRAVEELWPLLTPQRFLADLFADQDAMIRAGLTPEQARVLHRPPSAEFTVADVPLLDEAAVLLGGDAIAYDGSAEAEEALYAQGVLEVNEDVEVFEGLRVRDMIDVETLVSRNFDAGPALSTADRAARDRTWIYGHVIVDEAQELSPMAWRAVMRRIPTRSLTVVGDIAQTGAAAGAVSWAQSLEPYLGDRWREEKLMINYRTPAEIMEVAADVLAAVAPGEVPPASVRDGEAPPIAVRLPGLPPEELAALLEREMRTIGEGRAAVIVPDARYEPVLKAFPGAGQDSAISVLTVTRAKGLEFDAVVVVAPDEILAQSPRGGNDLYVAMTRATRRLTVVHDAALPEMLRRL